VFGEEQRNQDQEVLNPLVGAQGFEERRHLYSVDHGCRRVLCKRVDKRFVGPCMSLTCCHW
jgi:hypothetical protein